MTASPLTDAVLESLRRIDEIKDPLFRDQCFMRISHELHRLRTAHHPERAELYAANGAEEIGVLRNNICVLEDRIMLSGAGDDAINEALTVAEEHAHALRDQI